ncbi:hypothetical protein NEUTE2DRAFT_127037 [Neurospora tetrasperma FGSC 2509]|nr:hypothetical protein NEUTE2DRAFT_127037 [Neurospora tetrasperma FGSC 2509]
MGFEDDLFYTQLMRWFRIFGPMFVEHSFKGAADDVLTIEDPAIQNQNDFKSHEEVAPASTLADLEGTSRSRGQVLPQPRQSSQPTPPCGRIASQPPHPLVYTSTHGSGAAEQYALAA